MPTVRHLFKKNCVLKSRLGKIDVGDDGWVTNEDEFEVAELLKLPNFCDGNVYEPTEAPRAAANVSDAFDSKYLKVMKEVYAKADSYNDKGNVLLGELNSAFGKAGLPHIGAAKRNSLAEMIEEDLEELKNFALEVVTAPEESEEELDGEEPEVEDEKAEGDTEDGDERFSADF